MKHIIIGTAGHVDHGKTMLIKTLTGTDTDRLREEKERGISIELGFASLTLPSGRTAGIVDVPGHERFIKNMLAGISGIDLVLLVIAADEGVMPQTREHFDILQLLQVKNGIVVLTKSDLVEPDWLDLVREEVREFLAGTTLEDAPLIAVSSVTKEGIPELLQTIDNMVEGTKERASSGLMRLPVDRVFSVTGFGTVVTGTMVSGQLYVGDEVEIMPTKINSRVRGLQVHGSKVDRARAGQRVAINLAGVEVEEIERGNVVTVPNALIPSFRLDAKLHLLKNAAKELRHRTRVRLHIGTDEIMARVVLLDRDELKPGDEAYVQLQLEEKTVASKGDRFVIRSFSPMHTIGGGRIIDAVPKRHKRFKPEVIEALATKEKGTPEELVLQHITSQRAPVPAAEIAGETNLPAGEVENAVQKLFKEQKIKIIPAENKQLVILLSRYRRWSEQITRLLAEYHRKYPLREGYPKEELRSRQFSNINTKDFQNLLQSMEADGIIKLHPQTVALPGFNGEPTGKDANIVKNIEEIIKGNKFQPPRWKEALKQANIKQEDGGEYLSYLTRTGKIIKVADDIYFHRDTLKQAQEKVIQYLKENNSISIAETRDLLQTSRKYALPLLEYFDRERITRRTGDDRVLGARARN
ncbi:selenocysteine-specific elongation factor [Desulfohalotomaculum tongense]|uniref:selenocysteine-specific translation elongation factor n=1 Tax=Desulforadius tongensis TaxID=1216062 RepID=UPI00195F1EA5|nr:selenocysteine-specific translation elongation factor [Desulforadius tongensis]MBM7855901.1 selenocysteine-specific elongation factor [Desulforadius tongensis]